MFVYLLIKIHVHLQILDLPLVFQMAKQIEKKKEPQLAELPRVPLCPALRCHPVAPKNSEVGPFDEIKNKSQNEMQHVKLCYMFQKNVASYV